MVRTYFQVVFEIMLYLYSSTGISIPMVPMVLVLEYHIMVHVYHGILVEYTTPTYRHRCRLRAIAN